MTFKSILPAAVAALAALLATPAPACTTFRVQAKDGALVAGRSMELSLDLESKVMLVPRGFQLTSTRPDQKPGLAWTAKYGFFGINTLGEDIATDGLNEVGLSIHALYIPGFVEYQPFPADGSPAVSNIDLVNWVLSQFATVDQVREALPKISVYDPQVPAVGSQPLHWAVRDARGGSIVVEYVDGRLNIHDNPIGVLTNAPNFDWHMNNLRAHVNLTSINIDALKLGPVEIKPLGQGTGLLGLPGDYTPPSRFLRAAALANASVPAETAADAVNLAFHILNAVDIPLGVVAEKVPAKTGGAPTVQYEKTQWATVYDLTNRIAYFRTYGDPTIRKVALGNVDFGGKAIKHVPMPTAMHAEDVSTQAR